MAREREGARDQQRIKEEQQKLSNQLLDEEAQGCSRQFQSLLHLKVEDINTIDKDESGTAFTVTDQSRAEQEELNERLLGAAVLGDIEHLGLFLAKGADVNTIDQDEGRTALMFACREGDTRTAQYLVEEAKAEVNLASENGRTALTEASRNGHLKTVEYLVEGAEAEVNTIAKYSGMALLVASWHGHLKIVQYLVEEAKAEVNLASKNGRTALTEASQNGRLKTVKYLVKHKAEINTIDENGRTALTEASRNGHLKTVEYLLSRKSSLSKEQIDQIEAEYPEHSEEAVKLLRKHLQTKKQTASLKVKTEQPAMQEAGVAMSTAKIEEKKDVPTTDPSLEEKKYSNPPSPRASASAVRKVQAEQKEQKQRLGKVEGILGNVTEAEMAALKTNIEKLENISTTSKNTLQTDSLEVRKLLQTHARSLAEVAEAHSAGKQAKSAFDFAMQDPQAGEYYMDIISSLSGTYIATTVVKSDIISHDKSGAMGNVGKVFSAIGEVVPVVGTAVKAFGAALSGVDFKLQKRKLDRLAKLSATVIDMDAIARTVALELVREKRHINSSADVDIEKMLKAVFDDKVKAGDNVAASLVYAVTGKAVELKQAKAPAAVFSFAARQASPDHSDAIAKILAEQAEAEHEKEKIIRKRLEQELAEMKEKSANDKMKQDKQHKENDALSSAISTSLKVLDRDLAKTLIIKDSIIKNYNLCKEHLANLEVKDGMAQDQGVAIIRSFIDNAAKPETLKAKYKELCTRKTELAELLETIAEEKSDDLNKLKADQKNLEELQDSVSSLEQEIDSFFTSNNRLNDNLTDHLATSIRKLEEYQQGKGLSAHRGQKPSQVVSSRPQRKRRGSMMLAEITLFSDEIDNNPSPRRTPPPMVKVIDPSSRRSVDVDRVERRIAEKLAEVMAKSESKAAIEREAEGRKWEARFEVQRAAAEQRATAEREASQKMLNDAIAKISNEQEKEKAIRKNLEQELAKTKEKGVKTEEELAETKQESAQTKAALEVEQRKSRQQEAHIRRLMQVVIPDADEEQEVEVLAGVGPQVQAQLLVKRAVNSSTSQEEKLQSGQDGDAINRMNDLAFAASQNQERGEINAAEIKDLKHQSAVANRRNKNNAACCSMQ
jgi:ankyrin repeat protein